MFIVMHTDLAERSLSKYKWALFYNHVLVCLGVELSDLYKQAFLNNGFYVEVQ